MSIIKSPLRYPGGKSRAIPQIMEYIPDNFSEYREPFLGGGSLFLYLKQLYPKSNYWVNDLNHDLFCFWLVAQTEMNKLLEAVIDIKNTNTDGRCLFDALTALDLKTLSIFDKAVRFFILNRITFSGTVDCGGFSQKAFESRFTNSSIERLQKISPLLINSTITNYDYRQVIESPGKDVFIFLDPPYLKATNSKLYGKRGDLHLSFNHREFAKDLSRCPHKWLITYDDSPEIRENFHFAQIYEWELQYGMNNYHKNTAAKGKELFITNFEIQPRQNTYKQLLLF
jgi:DNA adenine methylase